MNPDVFVRHASLSFMLKTSGYESCVKIRTAETKALARGNQITVMGRKDMVMNKLGSELLATSCDGGANRASKMGSGWCDPHRPREGFLTSTGICSSGAHVSRKTKVDLGASHVKHGRGAAMDFPSPVQFAK